jgi:hypothetical protein
MRCHLFGGLTAALLFTLSLALTAGAEDKKDEKKDEGWKQLFNGKDLTGWKTHPDDKAKWEVVDGAIVGTGPVGHLYTERGDFQNFRFRIEAMISDKGNSGQMFRCVLSKGFPKGYEAQINATHGDPIRTGSLYPAFGKLTPEQRKKILVLEAPHKPDEWFTQEVIADGNHIIIKVNGKTTVDFVDENNSFTKGYLAIQQHNLGSVIKLRKAEIMDLPPSKP